MPSPRDIQPTVVAFAGRRIDTGGAKAARFPFANVCAVRAAIGASLEGIAPSLLIASAACGADLIALEAAANRHIRMRIVLPFPPARFRETSVVDRPNPEFWGRLYDDVMNQAERRGDVIVLHCRANDGSAYFAANHTLIADHSVAVAVSRRGHHELCLQVALAAETANDLMVLAHRRKRRRRDGRLARFGGHSSGGHLCGVALVTDWQKDFDLPANGDST